LRTFGRGKSSDVEDGALVVNLAPTLGVVAPQRCAARSAALVGRIPADKNQTIGHDTTREVGDLYLLAVFGCDHWLVSLPYPFGPELQQCHVGDRHVDFLWLVPITKAERDFKASHGQEELEERFEAVERRLISVGASVLRSHRCPRTMR
jgi:hypothetical protein